MGKIICNRIAYSGIMTPNEVRKCLGIAPIDAMTTLTEAKKYSDRITNCKNCGAPLPNGGKCEYCGTQY